MASAAATAASAHVFVATNAAVNFDRAASHFGMHFEINLEAILAGIDPEVKDTSDSPNAQEYNRLRAMPPKELKKAYEQFQPEFLSRPVRPHPLFREFVAAATKTQRS